MPYPPHYLPLPTRCLPDCPHPHHTHTHTFPTPCMHAPFTSCCDSVGTLPPPVLQFYLHDSLRYKQLLRYHIPPPRFQPFLVCVMACWLVWLDRGHGHSGCLALAPPPLPALELWSSSFCHSDMPCISWAGRAAHYTQCPATTPHPFCPHYLACCCLLALPCPSALPTVYVLLPVLWLVPAFCLPLAPCRLDAFACCWDCVGVTPPSCCPPTCPLFWITLGSWFCLPPCPHPPTVPHTFTHTAHAATPCTPRPARATPPTCPAHCPHPAPWTVGSWIQF